MTPPALVRTLSLSLSLSLLAAPAGAETAAPPKDLAVGSVQGNPTARVTVRSDDPDLVVGEVRSRAIAVGGGHVAAGVGWDEKCTAPCSFTLASGRRELVFRGQDFLLFREMRLKPGDNNVYVDPGSSGLRTGGTALAVVGMLALVVGGSILITRAILPETESDGTPNSFREKTRWALPLTLGGAAGMGGGIALAYVGRVRVEEHGAGSVGQGVMLRASGSF